MLILTPPFTLSPRLPRRVFFMPKNLKLYYFSYIGTYTMDSYTQIQNRLMQALWQTLRQLK